MPKFIVNQLEVHSQAYEIEAESRVDAIRKLVDGDHEGIIADGESVCLDTDDTRGMPVEGEFSDEEIEALSEDGLCDRQGDYVPTISSVTEMPT